MRSTRHARKSQLSSSSFLFFYFSRPTDLLIILVHPDHFIMNFNSLAAHFMTANRFMINNFPEVYFLQ